jgi:peptidyl-prolyl cis-trans isomerase C
MAGDELNRKDCTPRCLGCRWRRSALAALLAIMPLLARAQAPGSSVGVPSAPGMVRAGLGSLPTIPASSEPGQATRRDTDPVVASIEGHLIYLSEVGQAAQTLPENLRSLPFDTVYPALLDRMIDHQALVMMARREGLEDDPQVLRDVETATERILEGALLAREAAPKVTERAIQAAYNRQYANRPATEEVHARHILVATEGEARKVIDDLRKEADFVTMAKLISKDPDAQKGGDLGFFRREQVWPGFADVAFALQPGQIASDPVHNEFGWHVIKVEERRLVAPPSYSDLHDVLRQELLADAVRQTIDTALTQMVVHKFNVDGSELSASRQSAGRP